MILGLVLLLLAIWLIVTIIGFVFHAVFWLAIVGIILFIVTAVVGWIRRNSRVR